MLIKNAIKNEKWEVESSWEWIPSEKRKSKEKYKIIYLEKDQKE